MLIFYIRLIYSLMSKNSSQNKAPYDLLIIGGGINGAGIARDAAGRGLKVLLVEMNDLASATSSKSTKLIHGGLRYLEFYEFSLVRKALNEREILLENAPHIIHPMKFILPHAPHLRPAWMIRLGLFLYDHLGEKTSLPKSRFIRLHKFSPENPLDRHLKSAFSYYDCTVDDARLVLINALAAQELGAIIKTRSRFISAVRNNDLWTAKLSGKEEKTVTAKVLINAAGPWVSDIIEDGLDIRAHKSLRLVKGSHIIVPRLFPHDDSYILQNQDDRIIFVIPYEDKYSLIGTTEVAYQGDPSKAEITPEEIDYLCAHVNQYFEASLPHGEPLSGRDILHHFSGVRPLYDDENAKASAVTRDYELSLRDEKGKAPLLSIFGGKITTYRALSENVLHCLKEYFPKMGEDWTAHAPLPGGDLPYADPDFFDQQLALRYPWLRSHLRKRYARLYGTRIHLLLDGLLDMSQLGKEIGPDLYEKEANYLIHHEWASSAEDILWRRTKLGLGWTDGQTKGLEEWVKDQSGQERF